MWCDVIWHDVMYTYIFAYVYVYEGFAHLCPLKLKTNPFFLLVRLTVRH